MQCLAVGHVGPLPAAPLPLPDPQQLQQLQQLLCTVRRWCRKAGHKKRRRLGPRSHGDHPEIVVVAAAAVEEAAVDAVHGTS